MPAARIIAVGELQALEAKMREFRKLDGATVELCAGESDALRRLRSAPADVVVTDPTTPVEADLAFAAEVRRTRPGVRVIVLAPAYSPQDLIAALRAQVFACFSAPFDYIEIAEMIASAINEEARSDDIEVVSGLNNWMTLRVSCHLMTAERLIRFMTELRSDLPGDERDLLIAAFREMLVNAMEHGAGFDAGKVVEVTTAKTGRAIVYHFRDPGEGFDREALSHAAKSSHPEHVGASVVEREAKELRPGGFGMLIARQVADELVYNEPGNEVLLIKYLDRG
jgi:anti-sigma regulatory factor (Ser/Thr protein kinase)